MIKNAGVNIIIIKNKKKIPIKQEYINIIKKNTGKPILKYYIINN